MNWDHKKVEGLVNELYEFKDVHHDVNKESIIAKKIEEILALFPKDLRNFNANTKAKIYYLQGKTLEAYLDYNNQAEDYLSKAVKFDPDNVDAWNSLGHCFWKKSDLRSAQNCYQTALSKKQNKVSLRELSRVLRLTPQTEDSKTNHIAESVEKAKQAVALDPADGESWYVLGNAYLSHYMVNTLDMQDLHKALKAYKQAEKNPSTSFNPDLHFNRAMIHRYLENYFDAFEEFKRAYELDPKLKIAKREMEDIESFIKKTDTLIQTKVNLNKKQLSTVTNIETPRLHESFKEVTLSELVEGVNKDCVISLTVLRLVSSPTSVPLVFLGIDRNGDICAISMYHVHPDAIREFNTICIPQPNLGIISFDKIQFKRIVVFQPLEVVVNKKRISSKYINTPKLSVKVFNN